MCPSGFLGNNCDIDVAVCTTGLYTDEFILIEFEFKAFISGGERCYNGGECIEGIGLDFSCNCADGYKGEQCDVEIDECESTPCANGNVLHYAKFSPSTLYTNTKNFPF